MSLFKLELPVKKTKIVKDVLTSLFTKYSINKIVISMNKIKLIFCNNIETKLSSFAFVALTL